MAEWSCNGLQIRLRRFDSDSGLHIKPRASGVFCCPLSPASPPPPAAARIGSPRIPVTGGGPLPAMRCPAFHPGSVSAAPGPVADTGSGEKPGDPTQAPAGKGQDATGGGGAGLGAMAMSADGPRIRLPSGMDGAAWQKDSSPPMPRASQGPVRAPPLPAAAVRGVAGPAPGDGRCVRDTGGGGGGCRGILRRCIRHPPAAALYGPGGRGRRTLRRVCAGRGKASAARPGGFMRFPGGRPRAGSASSAVLSMPGLYP